MKLAHMTICVVIGTLVTTGAAAQSDSAAKADVARLQGVWSMVAAESDGQRFTGLMLAGSRRVAIGNETTVHIGGALFMKANFAVDPSKKPKAIDYKVTGGATAGKTQLGIYDVRGDTVQFCFAEPGTARPVDFTAAPGSKRMCSVWKREKN